LPGTHQPEAQAALEAGQAGLALGHPSPRLGRPGARPSVLRLRVQSRTHWHRRRVTGSPWHGPPRLAAESLQWQDPTRARNPPGRRRPESTQAGLTPSRTRDPSPIGRPYDSDSRASHGKGHWHDPPTRLVRAAPGADSARPGEPERRDARREIYHRYRQRREIYHRLK
jgi:hypothetical protein